MPSAEWRKKSPSHSAALGTQWVRRSPNYRIQKFFVVPFGLDSVPLTEASTLIPRFSRLSSSRFGKFAVSPQE